MIIGKALALATNIWLMAAPTLPFGVQLTDTEKRQTADAIQNAGLNCPIVLSMSAEGIDARGIIFRIKCAVPSGDFAWDVRFIDAGANARSRYEPW